MIFQDSVLGVWLKTYQFGLFKLMIFLILISSELKGQNLRSFNGPFVDGKAQNGTASYSYYEDPETREYLKHGAFKYTFNGKGNYSGYDQVITGNFEKGLKHGTWVYKIDMRDFGSGNPYYTGTVTLVANYKNGYADGKWKEIRSYKTRKQYLAYGSYSWEPFGPVKSMTTELNFDKGKLVGSVLIDDEFSNFKAVGSYDDQGLATGTWMINDRGWNQNQELIYRDNFLYEIVARDNAGKIIYGPEKREDLYDQLMRSKDLSEGELEGLEVVVNVACLGASKATSEVKEYFRKILSNEYYLYSFIGGDLTFAEGISSGCEIVVKEKSFMSLSEDRDFVNAQKLLSNGDTIGAFSYLSKVQLNKRIRLSDRHKVTEQKNILLPIVRSKVEGLVANSDYITGFIESNLKYLHSDFGEVSKGYKIKQFVGVGNSMSDSDSLLKSVGGCDCTDPWRESALWVALDCFKKNPRHFEPYQVAVTESFFDFHLLLMKEMNLARSTTDSVGIEGVNYLFFNYDKERIVKLSEKAKERYERSKEVENRVIEFDVSIQFLSDINTNSQKKKILNEKMRILFPYLIEQRDSYSDIYSYIGKLDDLNLFLTNLIAVYSKDTRGLEKQLKDVYEPEKVYSILLSLM